MPAPLTVILPTLNSAATLGPTLASLYEGVQTGLIAELIFADGGSSDATKDIAQDVGATFVSAEKGRGTQLSKGATMAKTPWLLFLHSDTCLSKGWTDTTRAHMNTSKNAAYFQLKFASSTRAAKRTAAWANFRSKYTQLPYGDQGLLIPTSLYTSAGGYPPIPLMEDVALVRRLRGKLTPLNATATTSAARFDAEGYIKRGGKNLITLIRYFLGTPPEKLAKSYNSPPKDT